MKLLCKLLALAALMPAAIVLAEAPTATIAPDTLAQRILQHDTNMVILDVRTPEEFATGHVSGAINIPHDQLTTRLKEIIGAKDKDVVVYCRSGRRSALAQDTLAAQGFKRVLHLEGDMLKWQEEKRPLEK
jgi:phage shock protein E